MEAFKEMNCTVGIDRRTRSVDSVVHHLTKGTQVRKGAISDTQRNGIRNIGNFRNFFDFPDH